jgi:transcriptional regulator GlxA family with amidase domain
MKDRPIRSVGFLLIPDFALISYASVVEPLRAANQLAGRTLYSGGTRLLATRRRSPRAGSP